MNISGQLPLLYVCGPLLKQLQCTDIIFKVKATNLMTKLPSDFSISSIYLKYDMFIA